MNNRITHFEIQADDPERAAKFYQDAFGWEITKWDTPMMEYWMVMTAPKDSKDPGINGGLMLRKRGAAVAGGGANAYICTVQTDTYDAVHEKIIAGGGTALVPKFAFPGMAWQGYYLDTEGNTFGLHQTDPNAK